MKRARPTKSKTLPVNQHLGGPGRGRADALEKFSTTKLVKNLRHYQSELEIQNKALRFSQAAAEGASERFVTLFSNVPLALMVVDESGLVLEYNARALALLRPLEIDPPLSYLWTSLSAAALPRVQEGFAQAVQNGSREVNELEFSSASSGTFTGDLHISLIEEDRGSARSFICAIINQEPLLAQRSELRRSTQILKERNEQLEQNKSRLAAIINSSFDAIVSVDREQHIIVFNPTAATLFQCPTERAMGRPLTDFLPDAARALSYIDIASQAQLGEMQGLTARGENLPLEVSVSFEHHQDGDIITLFAHDLTAHKRMEAHRAALESQLRESQKMQAIGTMAGGIAHDFNNIISAILGNVALAQQDAAADSATQVSLAEIGKAGRRARDLVKQILTFSRNEPPHREVLQVADVVEETLRLVRVTLPPNITLVSDINVNCPLVMADSTQIEQALLNLCTNAIHAMEERTGTLRVTLEHSVRSASETPERRSGLRGMHVKLTVSDTGTGMSESTLQRVFEPFFTTKPVGQGTGLGLAVVHGIMRTHLGTVNVRSQLGSGSDFSLLFPVADAPAVTSLAVQPITSHSMGTGQRVMYVDDDEALVFLVKRVLTRRGYQVSTFTNPRQAIASLRIDANCCDLLVTDYNMPGFSGVELMREVKALRADLPVALASGYVTPEIEREALAAGARALIHKPNDVDELCATVQKLLTESNFGQ